MASSAGDAAHSFPPTGGLGLNSGIADVHNLAYKIAAVQQGWGGKALLESYGAERRHVAEVNSKQSVKNGKKIFSFLKAIGAAGIDDVEETRRNLYKTVRDPTKQDMIRNHVEGQREHFDNVSHFPKNLLRTFANDANELCSLSCISATCTAVRKRRRMLPRTHLSSFPVHDFHTRGSVSVLEDQDPSCSRLMCPMCANLTRRPLIPAASPRSTSVRMTVLPSLSESAGNGQTV